MKKHRKKLAIYTLLFVLAGLLVGALVWHFWITVFSLLWLLSVTCGILGAVLIFPKFFKRSFDLETIGIWSAILSIGFLVLLVGIFSKPRHVPSY